MKFIKNLAIVATLISAMSIASCGKSAEEADKQLTELAASSSSKDPSVSYQDKTLTYRYNVESSVYSRINPDSLKAKTLRELQSVGNRNLVKTLTDAKATVKYVYVCDKDSITFGFQPAELNVK